MSTPSTPGTVDGSRPATHAVPRDQPVGLLRRLATAGLAAPVLFAALVIIQGLLWSDYSHIRHPISGLAVAPDGWIQNLNVAVTGCLLAAWGVGLHLGTAGRDRAVGPALLVVSGLGLIGGGVFPATDVMGNGASHGVMFVIVILSAGIGLIVTSRRLARDPDWRPHAAYTLGSGVAVLALFLVVSGLAFQPDAPLHPWLGIIQRLLVGVWLTCVAVLAVGLRQSANTPAT